VRGVDQFGRHLELSDSIGIDRRQRAAYDLQVEQQPAGDFDVIEALAMQ
jgi:hypothetical protein